MGRAEDLYERLVNGGAAEIQNFIDQKITEELFLDYKRSANDGIGTALDPKDRSNLSRAISGFGNSEGGVIVWGVACSRDPEQGDVPSRRVPITDPARFKSWIEQATSGLTVPPHAGVRHHAIAEGFVLTLIPSGMHTPYQAIPENSYYIRAGSSFARAPHAVLAGMFGRRPQPAIRELLRLRGTDLREKGLVSIQVEIDVYNLGRGMAESCYLHLSVDSRPGPECQVSSQGGDPEAWWVRGAPGADIQAVMRPGYPLPPEAIVKAAAMEIKLVKPITEDLVIRGACGCLGAESRAFRYQVPLSDLHRAFEPLRDIGPEAIESISKLRHLNAVLEEAFGIR